MMQWVDDRKSPYGRKLVCTGADIDEAMEAHYLKAFNGTCNVDRPAFDVENFVGEKLRADGIEFEPEATGLPHDVLGMTRFNPDGTRLIRIAAELYQARTSAISRGRFRFTCAHEAFHAIFHTQLFKGKSGRSECLERHIREDHVEPVLTSSDFVEWQANRGAAALLMPHSIFREQVTRLRAGTGRGANLDLLIQGLSDLFEVSRQSAQIRLQTLKLLTPPGDDFALEFDGIDSFREQRDRKWS